MEVIQFLLNGFSIALQWHNILFVLLGVVIGSGIGALPGLGPMSGVALLMPFTAALTGGLNPEDAAASAIILLAGIYYGAMYGGSISSILLNTPGDAAAVMTTLDGYPMAKQGRAGAALTISAIASFSGGIVSLFGLIFLAKPLSDVALRFGPADYFSLMILGLAAVSGLAGKSMTKALIMTVIGLLMATVGIDKVSGVERFTFGLPEIYNGIEFLTVAVGLFALGEVFKTIFETDITGAAISKIASFYPTKQDMKDSAGTMIRGSLIGFFTGVLPGAGATIASFFSYIVAKKLSKHPEKFGKGAVEGVAAPESANNGAAGGAMIPMLTLGIPGSGTTAILMGALIMYNIQPGPLLFEEHPRVAWGLIASMFVGNFALVLLNVPIVRVFAKLIVTPAKYLIPFIIAISVFGVYTVQLSIFDLLLMTGCGVAAYFLAKNDFPLAPLVLAIVLGPMIENNMRRALTISNGDFMIFLNKPVSAVFLIGGALWLLVPAILKRCKKTSAGCESR
ncbi:tripartite tricarboxylate transporter permease [Ferviditalea candida]|uniref:Tripartite tricarboxylate transporter permease n=1 Tax=Ferviditalea candida TaxID=3108399 RepID=A0ABU5ZKZ7_9BACL|nr:tripartite tricarboxylate transporter permease [Paenibacillaceae bacterium T2]